MAMFWSENTIICRLSFGFLILSYFQPCPPLFSIILHTACSFPPPPPFPSSQFIRLFTPHLNTTSVVLLWAKLTFWTLHINCTSPDILQPYPLYTSLESKIFRANIAHRKMTVAQKYIKCCKILKDDIKHHQGCAPTFHFLHFNITDTF